VVTASLLDVNVLVALAWPAHEWHDPVRRWFARNSRRGWATCPFTQAALIRILSNPSFSPDAVTPREAVDLLAQNLKHPFHRFWPDELSFPEAVEPFRDRLVGHQQITDAYLLGLAIRKGGRLATLDRAVLWLLPKEAPEAAHVEIIPG